MDLTFHRCRPLLGTLVEVALPDAQAWATDVAFSAVARVDRAMSFHDEHSDLARLRRAPVGEAVQVDPETIAVLRLAERLYESSDGLFDVTVARELVADNLLPRPRGVDLAGLTGTAADIEIIDDRHVRCRQPLLIDLGGIAKGHAVDLAIAALSDVGVEGALVNAGGDLRVLGQQPQPVHLRAADGGLEGVLMLADAALASSSNWRDRRLLGDRVSVPHRGREHRAVVSRCAVSVVAPICAVADALTKVVLADPFLGVAMLKAESATLVETEAGRRAA